MIVLMCDGPNCYKTFAPAQNIYRSVNHLEELAEEIGWEQARYDGTYKDFCSEDCAIDYRKQNRK